MQSRSHPLPALLAFLVGATVALSGGSATAGGQVRLELGLDAGPALLRGASFGKAATARLGAGLDLAPGWGLTAHYGVRSFNETIMVANDVSEGLVLPTLGLEGEALLLEGPHHHLLVVLGAELLSSAVGVGDASGYAIDYAAGLRLGAHWGWPFVELAFRLGYVRGRLENDTGEPPQVCEGSACSRTVVGRVDLSDVTIRFGLATGVRF